VRQFLDYFKQYLTPENLQTAISQNLDLTNLIYNHYGLLTPQILPLFRAAMRLYWDIFEEAVTNVPRLRQALMKNPKCRQILQTPEAIKYINEQCERLYTVTYNIVWGQVGPA
jgi:hypothetical protein